MLMSVQTHLPPPPRPPPAQCPFQPSPGELLVPGRAPSGIEEIGEVIVQVPSSRPANALSHVLLPRCDGGVPKRLIICICFAGISQEHAIFRSQPQYREKGASHPSAVLRLAYQKV